MLITTLLHTCPETVSLYQNRFLFGTPTPELLWTQGLQLTPWPTGQEGAAKEGMLTAAGALASQTCFPILPLQVDYTFQPHTCHYDFNSLTHLYRKP